MDMLQAVWLVLTQNWVEILKVGGGSFIGFYLAYEVGQYLFGERPISGISDKRTNARYERYVNRNGRF